jgi:hypothetical protein
VAKSQFSVAAPQPRSSQRAHKRQKICECSTVYIPRHSDHKIKPLNGCWQQKRWAAAPNDGSCKALTSRHLTAVAFLELLLQHFNHCIWQHTLQQNILQQEGPGPRELERFLVLH